MLVISLYVVYTSLVVCHTVSLMYYIRHVARKPDTTLSSTPYRQLENQAPKNTGSNQLYNTLEFLMMA